MIITLLHPKYCTKLGLRNGRRRETPGACQSGNWIGSIHSMNSLELGYRVCPMRRKFETSTVHCTAIYESISI